jgi:polysaccharide biosynthesis/export protein
MKKGSILLCISLVVFSLIACSSSKHKQMPPLSQGSALQGEYQIGVDDQLQISVWKNPELSLSVQVRPDGKISMPLIGDLAAADLTARQLSENITISLNNYIKNPQVTVIVANPSSSDFLRRIRITGAVKNPQSIPYRDGMTVLDLVLLSGGLNDFASGNKAKLYRVINGERKVYSIKLDDLINDGDVETNYPLQPSDIVSVPERAF